jgi:hypothetical protein
MIGRFGKPVKLFVIFAVFWLVSLPVYAGFVVDYQSVDSTDSVIPQKFLDQARAKTVVFNHQSVGSNILEGLRDLASQNPEKYRITNPVQDYTRGVNGDPLSKINGFADLLNSGSVSRANVAMMKFCYVDNTKDADTIWEAYKNTMLDLEKKHPTVTFVWWTMPLMTSGDVIRDNFNSQVREFTIFNNKILFDIASIESHDPTGKAVIINGREVMYSGYTTDGGHLTSTSRSRVARAWWTMLARTSGWNPSGAEITPSPTLKPSSTPRPKPTPKTNNSPAINPAEPKSGIFQKAATGKTQSQLFIPDNSGPENTPIPGKSDLIGQILNFFRQLFSGFTGK